MLWLGIRRHMGGLRYHPEGKVVICNVLYVQHVALREQARGRLMSAGSVEPKAEGTMRAGLS